MPDIDDLDPSNLLDEADAQDETEVEDADEGEGDEGGGASDETRQGRDQDGRASQDGNERSPRVSRSSERIRSLSERIKEEQIRREALERQIAELNRPDPQALARQQAEEAERVAMMAPHEVAQYYANKSQQQMQQMLHRQQIQQMDKLDQIEFRSMVSTNPLAKRYADKVEEIVAEGARNGNMIPRANALAYAIGQDALKNASAAAKPQRAAGAARVAANTVRRGTPGGDVGSDASTRGNNSKAALEKRLANVII